MRCDNHVVGSGGSLLLGTHTARPVACPSKVCSGCWWHCRLSRSAWALAYWLMNGAEKPRWPRWEQCGKGVLRRRPRPFSEAEWAAVPAESPGTQSAGQQAAVTPGLSVSGPPEWAAALRHRSPHKGGSCPAQALLQEKPLSRAAARRRDMLQCPRGGIQACPLASADTHHSVCCCISCRGRWFWRHECPPLSAELFYLHFLNSLSR